MTNIYKIIVRCLDITISDKVICLKFITSSNNNINYFIEEFIKNFNNNPKYNIYFIRSIEVIDITNNIKNKLVEINEFI